MDSIAPANDNFEAGLDLVVTAVEDVFEPANVSIMAEIAKEDNETDFDPADDGIEIDINSKNDETWTEVTGQVAQDDFDDMLIDLENGLEYEFDHSGIEESVTEFVTVRTTGFVKEPVTEDTLEFFEPAHTGEPARTNEPIMKTEPTLTEGSRKEAINSVTEPEEPSSTEEAGKLMGHSSTEEPALLNESGSHGGVHSSHGFTIRPYFLSEPGIVTSTSSFVQAGAHDYSIVDDHVAVDNHATVNHDSFDDKAPIDSLDDIIEESTTESAEVLQHHRPSLPDIVNLNRQNRLLKDLVSLYIL